MYLDIMYISTRSKSYISKNDKTTYDLVERLLIYLNFLVSTSELLVEVWTGNFLQTELRATPVSKILHISFLIESNRDFGEKNSPTGSLIKPLNITISSILDY